MINNYIYILCPSLINLNESKIEYIYNTNIVNIIY